MPGPRGGQAAGGVRGAMSQPVLLKVYGNLWPAPQGAIDKLRPVLAMSMPDPALADWEDNLLRIFFEGIYFPLEECLAVIENLLTQDIRGKLDYLDLENWRLTRHIFQNGKISTSSAPLNNVLDYSGH